MTKILIKASKLFLQKSNNLVFGIGSLFVNKNLINTKVSQKKLSLDNYKSSKHSNHIIFTFSPFYKTKASLTTSP
ncbi:MAG: hypothetical protein NY202_02305 [Mollicutes bacterium UO1]